MVAALIAAAVGIFAYFHEFYGSFPLLRQGKGLWDANVYGPFLIPAVLYGLYRFEARHDWKQFLWLLAVVFLSIGILLSFSRAAWGNYFICVFLYFLLPPWPPFEVRVKKGLILFLLLLPVLIFVLTHSDFSSLFTQRLGFQSYDSDRFGTSCFPAAGSGAPPGNRGGRQRGSWITPPTACISGCLLNPGC